MGRGRPALNSGTDAVSIGRTVKLRTFKADAYHRRAEVDAVLSADVLSFDNSPLVERLRRHELASGRGIAPSLEQLTTDNR
jgi:hypothetical protein